jgi:origin recognition complex subunit 4
MDQDAYPTGRKRSLDDIENHVDPETPASIKRQKLDEAAAPSPSTPKALSAIASAISGVFGYGRQPQKEANGTVPPPSTAALASPAPKLPLGSNPNGFLPKAAAPTVAAVKRPAIKLAALRGTVWDNGDIPQTRKSTVPKRPAKAALAASGSAVPSPSALLNGAKANTQKHNSVGGSAIQPPRGILTPTKKRGRPRKNVTFNRGTDGEVFFQDLPKAPSTKKPRTTKAQKAQHEYDGIVCEICSKPDSNAPNEIILCDNCDFAVHQLCYDLAEIPQGDWLCKSCSQEDVLKTPSKRPDGGAQMEDPPQPAEVPDIPNLDQHLRGCQRVLLDRCLGRRRTRIFGQEEPYEKARQLVEQTVVAGEGNSMLIIGPRGCGKTTVRSKGWLGISAGEHVLTFATFSWSKTS